MAFKLRETVRDVLKTLALRADEKGLELASDVGTEVPDGVVGDPNRLRQVLVNLVGNAVKFTEAGEVVVRVRLESYVADRAALLRFAIADTGIGIPADKQGLIFHAFAQAAWLTMRMVPSSTTMSASRIAVMTACMWSR